MVEAHDQETESEFDCFKFASLLNLSSVCHKYLIRKLLLACDIATNVN